MKVAIRLDASTVIGTGHLARMLAVAGALRANGASVTLVSRQLDLDIDAMAAGAAVRLVCLPRPLSPFEGDPAIPHSGWAEVPQLQDAAETLNALASDPPDAVIVDHYAFDKRWHQAVRGSLGRPLMVIDDVADRQLDGDWLVDHNFHPNHAAKYDGLLPPGMRMLAGPSYAMIGPSYADATRYDFSPTVASIGIFLGGVDIRGDTLRVLEALEVIRWDGPVEVVTTTANPDLARLERAAAERANVSLSRDLPNLAGFFARHDLQIGAGGGAIWERCCIGPPTVCLVCAANQRLSVPFLDTAGIVVGYDMLEDALPQGRTLAETIATLIGSAERRRAMRDASLALVDGRGATRIAAALGDKQKEL